MAASQSDAFGVGLWPSDTFGVAGLEANDESIRLGNEANTTNAAANTNMSSRSHRISCSLKYFQQNFFKISNFTKS